MEKRSSGEQKGIGRQALTALWLAWALLTMMGSVTAAQVRPTDTPIPDRTVKHQDDRTTNVRDFGAKGDGVALDTAAINGAIQHCSSVGGGTVIFPAGSYLSGSIHLRSHVRIELQPHATIKGAPNDIHAYDIPEPNPWEEYQDFGHSHFHNALLWGEGLEGLAILGPGTIDGGGITSSKVEPGGGDKLLSLRECRDVRIENVTLLQGGHFALLATGCSNVVISNVQAKTPRDGFDLVGCRDVGVTGCDLQCLRLGKHGEIEGPTPLGGDDAVTLKSDWSLGRKIDCENIRITHCRLATACNALQIGSETVGDFRNISVSDIEVWHADKAGIGITSNDGGTVDGVLVENVRMTRVATPIFINVGTRLRAPDCLKPGHIRNITLRNITATDSYGYIKDIVFESIISGLPEQPLENLVLQNIAIRSKGGGTAEQGKIMPPYSKDYSPRDLGARPAYGLCCRQVRGLKFDHVTFSFERGDLRPAVKLIDVIGATFNDGSAHRATGAPASLMLQNVSDLTIHGCPPWPQFEHVHFDEKSF